MSDFKILNNYTEDIDISKEVINTCQDCAFSMYLPKSVKNTLHCTQGNIDISINGICNKFVNVLG